MAFTQESESSLREALEISGCTRLFGDKLEELQVEEYGKNLSGGQKQAAAIARCLLKNPDVLMFDEVTTHLDIQTRQSIVNAYAFQNTFLGKTRIIITHDYEIARAADRMLLFKSGTLREILNSE
jgi:ABC-type bacteriocin/lantibiotic exporter with double-glycine peptidase domain